MVKWCFKCKASFESADTCLTCGAPLSGMFVNLEYIEVHVDARRPPFRSEVAHLSKLYGVPEIDLAEFEISRDVLGLVAVDLATRKHLIPVHRNGDLLIIAMADPSDIFAIDDIKSNTGLEVEVVVASHRAIAEAIAKWYPL
jgi:hypothetical protein